MTCHWGTRSGILVGMTKRKSERTLCFHCGLESRLTMSVMFSGMRVQLCERCWGPLLQLVAQFQPHRPVLADVARQAW